MVLNWCHELSHKSNYETAYGALHVQNACKITCKSPSDFGAQDSDIAFIHCAAQGASLTYGNAIIIRLLARCFANNYIQIGMSLHPRLMFLIIITLLCLIRPESRLRPAIHDKAKILQMLLSLWKSMFFFCFFISCDCPHRLPLYLN